MGVRREPPCRDLASPNHRGEFLLLSPSSNSSSSSSTSHCDIFSPQDSSIPVDLIQGDNFSSSVPPSKLESFDDPEGELTDEVVLNNLLSSYRIPLQDREFLREYFERKKDKVGTPLKLVKGYLRLKKVATCGHRGHLLAQYRDGELKRVSLVPHRCSSVFCSYCNFYESRKRLKQISDYFSYLVARGESLTFVTLTIPNEQDIFTAIKKINKAFQRLYQFRLFGKRNWPKVVREFRKETIRYYRSLRRQGLSPKEALRKVKYQIELFRRFERAVASYDYDTKFGQIFKAVWKFELTYNERTGFHAHWHGITTLNIPKLLLTVLARLSGFGEICDIRRVRGRKAIVELGKYVAKSFELQGLGFEKKLDVEIAMHSFRKLRVWNISKYELLLYSSEEEEEYDFVPLPTLRYRIRSGQSLAELFDERRSGDNVRFSVSIDNDTVFHSILSSQGVPCPRRHISVECEFDVDKPYRAYVISLTDEFKELVRQGFWDFLVYLDYNGYKGSGVDRLRAIYRQAYMDSLDDEYDWI